MYKYFLLLSLFSFSVADDKTSNCFTIHNEMAATIFSTEQLNPLQVEEKDINRDGEIEYIYIGNCGRRLCDSVVLANINGCFSKIFESQGNITFLDKIPKNISERNYFSSKEAQQRFFEYKPLSHQVSSCAGATVHNSISLFDKKKNEYVQVTSSSIDLCDLQAEFKS